MSEPYAWHISDLQIYDKPRELNHFGRSHADENSMLYTMSMKLPPRSWCYVEESI